MMEDNSNSNDESAIRLANIWAGRTVTISGVGGTICIDEEDDRASTRTPTNKNKEGPRIVKTSSSRGIGGLQLLIERAPAGASNPPGAVAFRVVSTTPPNNDNETTTTTSGAAAAGRDDHDDDKRMMYLTNIMYGDELRQSTAEHLASIPSLLAEHIPLIVDFCVGRPTEATNFEGAGFNYSPMTIQPAAGGGGSSQHNDDGNQAVAAVAAVPNKLQMFVLEEQQQQQQGGNFGVKSLFGTYWRSQHWHHNIVSQSPHCLGDEHWRFLEVAD
mmetsp:Transcript_12519/g.20837  ORF Transcript_12519/g.20837 Transcript_12519/m.20837 type:complete len:272 (+) Transcript_12519:72-887(+)|eukprot:CAMPEP_0119019590 /NCGR_PEP_ID=MMETSP1176-20130426/22239_1 /TAXON_ID=265551 /ORGANISM="Synedropsis recta cf, Strain CCMP1620" /LENGTH=271 /DNA_ID=CAMNT_0006973827 /DNA_START=69 /DNA_END=884 /DNA_ORIENTATION=+